MPFSPDSIADLVGWYASDQISPANTYVDGDGNTAVDTWDALNTSGLGDLDMVYGPTLVDFGVGKEGLYFTGGEYGATFTGITYAQPNTVFVCSLLDDGVPLPVVMLDSRSSSSARHYIATDSSLRRLNFWAGGTEIISSVDFPSRPAVLSMQFNGVSSFARQDGTQVATGNPGSYSWDALRIGMRYTSPLRGWRGYIFEVLIYDAALTTAQMQDVENYLLARWVLSNTHAVTHNIDTAVQPTVFPTLRGTHGMSTKGYAAPLGSTHASAAGTEVEGYAAPLGSTHDLVSALDAVASNYHPVGVPEHAITMESYLTPQIEVPASVPAGVTPRVFKRKHWAFP